MNGNNLDRKKNEDKLLEDLQMHIDNNIDMEMNKDIKSSMMRMRKLARSNSKLYGRMASSIMVKQLLNQSGAQNFANKRKLI